MKLLRKVPREIRRSFHRLLGLHHLRMLLIDDLDHRFERVGRDVRGGIDAENRASWQALMALVRPFGPDAERAAFAVMGAVLADDLDRAIKLGVAADLAPEARKAMVDFVNHTFLFPRSLEWTSHGVRRSFRFWSDEQIVSYLREAKAIIETLRTQLTEDICFGFGTALGCNRGGRVIPHDEDADMILALPRARFPTIGAGVEAVNDLLSASGFRSFIWEEPRSLVKVPTSVGRDLDIFVGLSEGETVSWFPGPRAMILHKDVYPPRTQLLHGEPCPMPADHDAYLRKVYGDEWRVPNGGFRHKWESTDFDDILPKAIGA